MANRQDVVPLVPLPVFGRGPGCWHLARLMNFLAHYLLATKYLAPIEPLSYFVVGTSLPDLLPLASVRLRPASLLTSPYSAAEHIALREGALSHFAADAAFHKLAEFHAAQERIADFILEAGFEGIRVRRFFLAHILVELALDAALLQDAPYIVDDFYCAFNKDEINEAARWTEFVLNRGIPDLYPVLARFARSRYLQTYRDNAGVATGVNRLCARARQDMFEGANDERLRNLVSRSLSIIDPTSLMSATAEAMRQFSYPPATVK